MVKNADKPLFGTGGAMQFLVYYQATDMLPCEVINGKEKGTALGHISKYTKYARSRIKNQEADPTVGSIGKKKAKESLDSILFPFEDNFVFLDSTNGDYYCYKASNFDINTSDISLNEPFTNQGKLYY